ncbi:MAG: UDP-N-acetylmuramate dehydrogenase [Fluviicoccus sp.]|uniref:UDP-N-acetylmuramate dehydrogenase n=1 Tax=Fluviicoccus sp. TaxID=2003552 RepID=UPI00271E2A4D|nr:UDP-N-acetylmuramate dehydrogenase [Fluviicoccus sp.]MDO8329246.1 UDP-N-acetylmuramate dehydrogenase [Fluviicoccus sp.]
MFLESQPLTRYNTFGIKAQTRFLALVDSDAELRFLLLSVTARNLPLMVLGSGSNMVLRGDFPGLVLVMRQKGIQRLSATQDEVVVEAAAGEIWHDFVQYCLAQGWYGLENLSLIPGTVGAAPVQNIGAYGVEVKDSLCGLTAMHRETGVTRDFTAAECRFAYRDSIFKQDAAGQWIITRVRFRLSQRPLAHAEYGDIRRQLQATGVDRPSPRQVADAIIAIRRSKLPDPAQIGNAGSFFKNPVVPTAQFDRLRQDFPELPAYPQASGVKLAAGWLIERAGWKGKTLGEAGVYDKQALVLVNRGKATGCDILTLAAAIQRDVSDKFGVALEIEPVIVG